MSYILVREDPPHFPAYSIDGATGQRVPLVFEHYEETRSYTTFVWPNGSETHSYGYKAVLLNAVQERQYVEWANLDRSQIKQWLKDNRKWMKKHQI